jgi:hypothetical protein
MTLKKYIQIAIGILAISASIFFIYTALQFKSVFNAEKTLRAKAAYERGETFFKQSKYRKAMWEYQMVNEFYSKPHSKWADLAEEKEWICRGYLSDWIPPEGPLDKDVRVLHPDIYNRYRDKLLQITPVPEISTLESSPRPSSNTSLRP